MSVYIAMDYWQEGNTILGVFSTREKADECAWANAGNAPFVDEYEVDKEEA